MAAAAAAGGVACTTCLLYCLFSLLCKAHVVVAGCTVCVIQGVRVILAQQLLVNGQGLHGQQTSVAKECSSFGLLNQGSFPQRLQLFTQFCTCCSVKSMHEILYLPHQQQYHCRHHRACNPLLSNCWQCHKFINVGVLCNGG